mgnify:FL=1
MVERVFICSPSFDGDFCAPFAESLVGSIKDLAQPGIKTAYNPIVGLHGVDIARDILASLFLKSDCTHMLQIDSDLGWSADAPRRMLAKNAPVIGGAYPIKADVPLWPVKRDGGAVTGLPGGFLMVRRDVVERLSVGPTYECSSMQFGRHDVHHLFTREFTPGGYIGEDYAFCNRVMAAGYGLDIEPDIDFVHVGKKAWNGNYSADKAG